MDSMKVNWIMPDRSFTADQYCSILLRRGAKFGVVRDRMADPDAQMNLLLFDSSNNLFSTILEHINRARVGAGMSAVASQQEFDELFLGAGRFAGAAGAIIFDSESCTKSVGRDRPRDENEANELLKEIHTELKRLVRELM
jgi:hypothetical protein